MIFMDLTSNNEIIFTGQPCFNLTVPGVSGYLNYTGAFLFSDTQGTRDPVWDALTSRYVLLFSADGFVTAKQLHPDVLPMQQFSVILGGQNMVIRLATLDIDTTLPTDSTLPIGADAPYLLQSFLAVIPQYAVTGYWVPSYAV